jgi:hypothetical protein
MTSRAIKWTARFNRNRLAVSMPKSAKMYPRFKTKTAMIP